MDVASYRLSDNYMEIEIDSPAIYPLGNLIGDIRERAQVRFFLLPHLVPAAVTFLEGLMIEPAEFFCNTLFE